MSQAGLTDVVIRPIVAFSVVYESTLLRRGHIGPSAVEPGDRSATLKAHAYTTAERVVMIWNPNAADCIAAVATK